MGFKILSMLTRKGSNARPGITLTNINGVTIHMTDNWGKGSGAIAHANYLKNSGASREASWHYCVDDTYATQSIPDNEVAYHCGNEIGNYTTISIEICVNPDSDLKIACDNAANLTASLLNKYNLSIDKLYRHYDWSGKWCPSQLMNEKPYSWAYFKMKVATAMKNNTIINSEIYDKNDTPSNIIGIGSRVYFDGKSHCYATSNGEGQGVIPPVGYYVVTRYNPGSLYSVHIGTYGWVPAINCGLDKEINKNIITVGTIIEFDGKTHCYATSNGDGQGMIPPAGKYKVTYYNKNSKYPVHIGTYGWVSNESCRIL